MRESEHPKHRLHRVILAFGPLLLAGLGSQTPTIAQQAPSPLDRFAGDWELRDRSLDGKVWRESRISEYCRWSTQRTFMICEEREHGQPVADVTLMWRDAHARVYRYRDTGVDGSTDVGTIAISPSRWLWTAVAGRQRDVTINDWIDPNEVHYSSRHSDDAGKTWLSTGSGTETRIMRS